MWPLITWLYSEVSAEAVSVDPSGAPKLQAISFWLVSVQALTNGAQSGQFSVETTVCQGTGAAEPVVVRNGCSEAHVITTLAAAGAVPPSSHSAMA